MIQFSERYTSCMQLIAIPTPLLKPGDDLVKILRDHALIQTNDILVISSKAIATVEGRAIDLRTIRATDQARELAKTHGGTPEFRQAILEETERMHGTILTGCPQAMLTELKPDGLTTGSILVANAGLDESNVDAGYAIGWPLDPVRSASMLHHILGNPIIISDSTCRPRRLGVTAIALAVAGFDPVRSLVGSSDLFGKKLRMTNEAIADQLATAANILMGNADQSVPAVIVRDHGIPQTEYVGWVPGIAAQEDLFQF